MQSNSTRPVEQDIDRDLELIRIMTGVDAAHLANEPVPT